MHGHLNVKFVYGLFVILYKLCTLCVHLQSRWMKRIILNLLNLAFSLQHAFVQQINVTSLVFAQQQGKLLTVLEWNFQILFILYVWDVSHCLPLRKRGDRRAGSGQSPVYGALQMTKQFRVLRNKDFFLLVVYCQLLKIYCLLH